jgi:hypothetical protein
MKWKAPVKGAKPMAGKPGVYPFAKPGTKPAAKPPAKKMPPKKAATKGK